MNWKIGLISTVFAMSVTNSASAENTVSESELTFPIQTRVGARTIADCRELEEDGSVGLKFLQALDRGFHVGNPYYRSLPTIFAVKAHLRHEGISEKHYEFIEKECAKRLDA